MYYVQLFCVTMKLQLAEKNVRYDLVMFVSARGVYLLIHMILGYELLRS